MMNLSSSSIAAGGGSLAGRLLVATPAVTGPVFARSVIYIGSHDATGAMGFIVNQPLEQVSMVDVCEQLSLQVDGPPPDFPIQFGGPVEPARGFIIHSSDYKSSAGCILEHDGIAVNASVAMVEQIARRAGPTRGMLTLGYAGWSPKQLETEMESGGWVIAPATPELLFDTPNPLKWGMAIASLGFDIGNFSTVVGHA